MAAAVKVKQRKMPDFNGVPGTLVKLEEIAPGLVFGARTRTSPYDALLDQLAAAPIGSALEFGDVRAKTSLWARSKKKDMRISFAERGGKLYVRFDGSTVADVKDARRKSIVRELKGGKSLNAMQLSVALRAAGDGSADGPLVAGICRQMVAAGDLVGQEGGTFRLPVGK